MAQSTRSGAAAAVLLAGDARREADDATLARQDSWAAELMDAISKMRRLSFDKRSRTKLTGSLWAANITNRLYCARRQGFSACGIPSAGLRLCPAASAAASSSIPGVFELRAGKCTTPPTFWIEYVPLLQACCSSRPAQTLRNKHDKGPAMRQDNYVAPQICRALDRSSGSVAVWPGQV